MCVNKPSLSNKMYRPNTGLFVFTHRDRLCTKLLSKYDWPRELVPAGIRWRWLKYVLRMENMYIYTHLMLFIMRTFGATFRLIIGRHESICWVKWIVASQTHYHNVRSTGRYPFGLCTVSAKGFFGSWYTMKNNRHNLPVVVIKIQLFWVWVLYCFGCAIGAG